MRVQVKMLLALAALGLSLPCPRAQENPRLVGPRFAGVNTAGAAEETEPARSLPARTLNDDDRLTLLAAALDNRVRHSSDADCSHLVHGIYQQAGFPYQYSPSSDLYAGVDSFERVKQPKTGDLVVWRGHVGIVIKPSEHVFFSLMSGGPGIDDYETTYWKNRGHPRFYRYVKRLACSNCVSNVHRLLKTTR